MYDLIDARNQMVSAHEGLLHHIVAAMPSAVIARVGGLDDAKQIGRLAVWKAINRFDPSRGLQFSTLASVCIRHALQREANLAHNRHFALVRPLVYADGETMDVPARQPEPAKDFGHLHTALKRMRQADREALVECFFQGAGHLEMARRRGVSRGRVGQVVRRAIGRLRVELSR
jgi:RNA polymerase sigma factor (sigma-70 family)